MHFVIRAWTTALIIAAASSVSSGAWAAEATLPTGPGAQPGVPFELQGKPFGNWAKADGAIRGLVAGFAAHRDRGEPGEFRPANPTLQFTHGRIVVDVVAIGDPEALLEDLRKLGMKKASSYGQVISGQLPPGAIARAVALPGLQAISAARKPHTNVGAVDGEGATAMYADQPPASGYTGAGITIGVLSDSFDYLNGYADDKTSGDLPAGIDVLDDSASPGIDEGRAMMQLAYDVAPGANFAFHTAFGGAADFANGIGELAATGPQGGNADVIVDDVIYFTEPMFQDGIIARAVDDVVAAGVPYFSSAGNQARQSYEATYVDSGEQFFVSDLFGLDYRGRLHDFDPGNGKWYQEFYVPEFSSHRVLSLVLQWDQPFASLSDNRGAEVDVDVYLTTDANSSTLIASSIESNSLLDGGHGEPVELLQFQVGGCDGSLQFLYGIGCADVPGTYRLLISFYDGGFPNSGGPDDALEKPGKLKYVLFDRNITWAHATDSSTVYGHSNAAGAEAVGAAYWQATPAWNCDFPADDDPWDDCEMNVDGQLTPQLESYSSAGPTDILFDADGYAALDLRPKPEIVGPDGTNTTFFYSDSDTDPDDFPNFFGTSASAPHLAAVAALMLEAKPTLTPTEIYDIIEGTALNMNPRSGPDAFGDIFDDDTGWGFVQADRAIAAVTGGFDFAPTVTVTYPADGATVIGTVTVTADASDDNGVTQVEFFVDGVSIGVGTDSGDGWSASWDSTAVVDGSYAVSATATDTNQRTASHSVDVTVNNVDDPPTVTVTDPADGATVSGTVTVTADASDDNGVDKVEFFVDGVSIGVDADSGGGWSVSWDTTPVADGSYAVSAEATDTTLQKTASDSVNVTVTHNTAPVAAFTVAPNPCPFVTLEIYGSGWQCDFTNTSTDPDSTNSPANDNDIVSFEWDYGDETNNTATWSPSALYTVPGTYTVTLTVTDSQGVSDSTSQSVTMAVAAHIGDLDNVSVSSGGRWTAQVRVVVLGDLGNPLQGATVNGSWAGANGDGNCTTVTDAAGRCTVSSSRLKNNIASVTFTVEGISVDGVTSYTPSLNIDPDGDSYGPYENIIDVTKPGSNQAPTASITTPSDSATFASGASILFEGSANDTEDGNLTGSLSWTSDLDGAIGSGASFSAVLSDGAHSITASVTDTGGSTGSATIGIIVGTPPNQPPVASFTLAGDTCDAYDDLENGAGWLCQFTNTSWDSDSTNPPANDNDIVSFEWDYGDGTYNTSVWHAGAFYTTEGFFTVTLSVTDSEVASDSASMVVQIGNPPPPLVLDSATGYKVRGKHTVDLDWSGATVGADIYRDGSLITTISQQSGSYTDNIGAKGGATYSYVVCEADTDIDDATCSAPKMVVF